MQLLIVTLLICVSSAYLVFKWLPKKHKQKLSTWLIKKSPQLNGVVNKPNDGCSSGCSSCGACEQTSMKTTTSDEIRIIRIVSNFSHSN